MLSETTVFESWSGKLQQDNRRLKLTVGALLLVLAAVPLIGATVPEQDLTGRFLFLATARTGTMQRELDQAAAAGYRILTGSPTSGHEMVLVLEKVVTPPDTYQYRLLATTRTGTMQRELDVAAADGFRLLPATMMSKTEIIGNLFGVDAREIVMIMERSPNSSRRYQYKLLATNFTSTLQAEMAQAVRNGYEVVGMVSRDEHILILERTNQEETRRLQQETQRLQGERGHPATSPAVDKVTVPGTGWVTDSGYIVTANHIVADADRISVVLTDGQSYNATVAVADEVNDVAVLSVGPEFPRAGGLQLASAAARPAASVLALGYPLPDIMGSTLKVTTGTISAIYGFRNDPRTYQFSAQVQSGNSGGPLLNLQGEVIGVVTAKLNAAEVFAWTGALPESVSYAVKSAYLHPLLDSLPEVSDGEADPVAADLSPEDIAERATPFVVMVIGEPLTAEEVKEHLERDKERLADASAARPGDTSPDWVRLGAESAAQAGSDGEYGWAVARVLGPDGLPVQGVTIILDNAITHRMMFSDEHGEAWFSRLRPDSAYTVAIDNNRRGLTVPKERRVVVEAGRFTYFTVVMGQ